MKISIVTPSLNQAEFIQRTLQSVAQQTGADIEHIVFDGGSSDGTLSILEKHGCAIRWSSQPDKGQADAVNRGISASEGEIIGWLNSDDVYKPHAIATVAAFMAANPEIDVVYGLADYIDRFDRVIGTYPTEPWNYDRLLETCFICQPAVFFRKRIVERYGLLDEHLHYCMDYEYWLRLGRAGARFAYLPEKLACSRFYAETKTLGARVAVHAEINDVVKRYIGNVPTSCILNYARAVADQHNDIDSETIRHAIRLFGTAIWAGWHWNRRIEPVLGRALAALGRRLVLV